MKNRGFRVLGVCFSYNFCTFQISFLIIKIICLGAVQHLLLDSTFGFEVLLEREEHRRALQAANCSGHPERMDQSDGTKRVDGATPI